MCVVNIDVFFSLQISKNFAFCTNNLIVQPYIYRHYTKDLFPARILDL